MTPVKTKAYTLSVSMICSLSLINTPSSDVMKHLKQAFCSIAYIYSSQSLQQTFFTLLSVRYSNITIYNTDEIQMYNEYFKAMYFS